MGQKIKLWKITFFRIFARRAKLCKIAEKCRRTAPPQFSTISNKFQQFSTIFEKQIKNPNINPNFDMIYSHELISTYLQLFRNNLIDGMPIIWSIENDNFMKDHNICLKDQARIFNLELCPVVSLMGAIVAAETIKLLTNKYILYTGNKLIDR